MLRRRWLVAAASFTAAAVLFTGQVRADYWYARRMLPWRASLGISLIDWQLWTILAPAALTLAARVPVTRDRLVRALAIHIPAGLLIAGVKVVAEGVLTRRFLGDGPVVFGAGKLYMAVLVYWTIVASVQYADQRRLSQERELRASRLQAELARAQIDALRMQLHPHFLFNTLNAISGLMREDVEAADVMLTQLGELLRMTLRNEDRQRVPLSEEIGWLRTYLAIQQTRYGPRLMIDVDVPDACERALVPTLILQPLVENAIRHGFSARPGPGRVSIQARARNGRVGIDVEDDGPGVAYPVREGYGLRNTRSRLQALYGDMATLIVSSRGDKPGARSRLEIPFATDAGS